MNRRDRTFSPLLFRLYASDLSEAIYKLSREQSMSITGLQQGSIRAKLADIKKLAQARQAAGIARIEAKHSEGLAKVDAALVDVERKIDKEVADTLQEFAEFTNGGPVLDDVVAEPETADVPHVPYPSYP